MEIPLTTHAIAKAIGCSTQIDGKILLQKATSTQYTEHREVEPVPKENVNSSCYQKRYVNTNSLMASFLQDMLGQL